MSNRMLLIRSGKVPNDLWEEIEPMIGELDPPKGNRTQERGPSEDAQCDHLPNALWLPVEQATEVSRR